ncbi:hypothetical protein KSS87_003591 [Heliosperma pusillum]|nr:hypothetical protein KSS87_003591 [Heliosperma pusillum]
MAISKHIVLISLVLMSLMSSIELAVVSGETNITLTRLPLGQNQTGPEVIAFDCKGHGPYVGISDGRILKWRGHHKGWKTFAVTAQNRSDSCDGLSHSPLEKECGRPLGLRFDKKTCELYIADSSFGLMKVGRKGGVATSLVAIAEGIPFKFVNGLDIDLGNQVVYFTETSTNYNRWEFMKAVNNSDKSGRFMKYDMKTGDVTVLLRNLSFANGVALSKYNDFVFVAESTGSQLLKYWLTGDKAQTYEQIPLIGRPDNINRTPKGDFWVALRMTNSIKINHLGELLTTLVSDEIVNPSDVSEFHHRLWIGFFDKPFIYHT